VLPEDFAQFASQKIQFPVSRPNDHLSKVPAVRTMCHTVRTPFYLKHHPSGRRKLSVRTFHYVEKFRTASACIRPDVSTALPDDSQCSTSFRISFQSTVMGRSLQPSKRRGFPPDALIHKASIVIQIQTSGC
jgi:hypothetical protein